MAFLFVNVIVRIDRYVVNANIVNVILTMQAECVAVIVIDKITIAIYYNLERYILWL